METALRDVHVGLRFLLWKTVSVVLRSRWRLSTSWRSICSHIGGGNIARASGMNAEPLLARLALRVLGWRAVSNRLGLRYTYIDTYAYKVKARYRY